VEFGQNAADMWTEQAENLHEREQWITVAVTMVTPDVG
jgi:hypothetical protein